MEGKKTVIIAVSIVIVIVVVATIGFFFVFDKASDEEGITAKEGLIIADDIAQNWSTNATLIGVRVVSSINSYGGHFTSMTSDGHFTSWNYKFIDSEVLSNESECVDIRIYTNGTYHITYDSGMGDKKVILNWNIDSDKAYSIARNVTIISSYISRSSSPIHFFLSSEINGTPVWYIDWMYNAGRDDFKWANIEIDATTGEVLYVKAD